MTIRMLVIDVERGPVEVALFDDDADAKFLVETAEGPQEVDATPEEVASTIGEHHAAIRHYLVNEHDDDDESRLAAFAGTRFVVKGETYELQTDPEAIESIALAGDLDYDDIYVLA